MTAPTTPSPERQPADAGGGLLPCPWCGGELYVSVQDIDNFIGHVECGGCDMRGPISEWKYEDPEEAKADAVERWNAAWNRRSPAPHPQPDARAWLVQECNHDGVLRSEFAIVGDRPWSGKRGADQITAQPLYLSAPAADDGWRPSREEVVAAMEEHVSAEIVGTREDRAEVVGIQAAADAILALHPAAPTDEVGK